MECDSVNLARCRSSACIHIARLPPARRRAQLLACAMKVFAEHGLGAGNHALIAQEAGVSVPTVFVYFATRAALIEAVLSEVEDLYRRAFAGARKDSRPAVETLLQLGDTMTRAADTHPYHSRVYLEWSIAVRAQIWPRFRAMQRYMVKVLTELIERGRGEGSCRLDLIPEDEAQILHAASYALAQMQPGARASRIAQFQRSTINTILIHPLPAVARPPLD
jgi:TetR/AcrR family hemagglutinin/protease transcriptional regulator